MENASKALIIAGAILISIVLITLGVVILGQGQDIVNNSNMDSEEIAMFNKKFTQYTGNKVSGAKVNALIEAVIANNAVANRDGNTNKLIKITPSSASGIVVKNDNSNVEFTNGVETKASSGKLYEVRAMEYNTQGYIRRIDIRLPS